MNRWAPWMNRWTEVNDEELATIIDYVKTKTFPAGTTKGLRTHLRTHGERYMLEDEILFHHSTFGKVLVLPSQYRTQVLMQYHDSHFGGHLSASKVTQRLRPKYFLPTLARDVTKWCKSCQICAARKNPRHYIKAPLKCLPVGGAFERIAKDPFQKHSQETSTSECVRTTSPNGQKHLPCPIKQQRRFFKSS